MNTRSTMQYNVIKIFRCFYGDVVDVVEKRINFIWIKKDLGLFDILNTMLYKKRDGNSHQNHLMKDFYCSCRVMILKGTYFTSSITQFA